MRELGERDVIRVLTRVYGAQDLPLGYEDDVSAVEITRNLWMILKCDMLVESTDVPPGMTDFEAARKSIVSVISDFAA
ncbi:MAG TPA: hypothetical protein VE177_05545, partial [Candidatus Binatus sp.]|nr:hypothetical protein [Candidatus Binatus sp.]